jgi:hypothetical protein
MTEAGHIENLRMQAHQFYRYGNFRKKQKKKRLLSKIVLFQMFSINQSKYIEMAIKILYA